MKRRRLLVAGIVAAALALLLLAVLLRPRRLLSRGASMHVTGLDDAGHFVVRAHRAGHEVLGHDSPDSHTSYLCDPNGALTEIHRHLDRRDVVEFLAADINNKGQITGLLTLKNQPDPVAVVLEPIRQRAHNDPVARPFCRSCHCERSAAISF